MSLTIGITTPEGIVLASDSRQTYKNSVGSVRIGSDSATKLYRVTDRIGITVAGPAFLKDLKNPGSGPKGIGSYIQDFINEKLSKTETVESVTDKIQTYLTEIYQPDKQLDESVIDAERQIKAQGGKILKKEKTKNGDGWLMDIVDGSGKPGKALASVMPISLIVAGYDEIKKNDEKLSAFLVNIPGKKVHRRKPNAQDQYGAIWTGQTDVVTRVVKGFDPKIAQLDIIQSSIAQIGEEEVSKRLGALEYIINWGAMTLQDATEFAKLMIKTTTAIQRFSDGINLMPGDIPGVGGPIDVAVILPIKGFYWHQHKSLKLEKAEVV